MPRHWYYFFGSGVCSLVFFNWCYFSAISTSSMSVAAVLLYTSPVFVTLLSALFFRERITSHKVAALALTFWQAVSWSPAAPAGPAVCVLSDDTIWIRSRIWLRSVFNFWQAGP